MTKKHVLNVANGHIIRLDIMLHEMVRVVRAYVFKFHSKLLN